MWLGLAGLTPVRLHGHSLVHGMLEQPVHA